MGGLDNLDCPAVSDCFLSGGFSFSTVGFTEDETWRTSDGGITWQKGPRLENVQSMSCPTPDRCWLVGSTPSTGAQEPSRIEYSSDGGRSWLPQVALFRPGADVIDCLPERANVAPRCMALVGGVAMVRG